MSWNSLANNQTVSFNNLQNAVNNGVFTAKTSIPASNEQITKTDANTYVNINTSFAPYAAKASNQLVVKSDLLQSVKAFGLSVAYFDADGACNATVTDFVRYHNGAGDLPVVNDKVYTNSAGTDLLNGQNLFFAMGILIPEFEPISNLSSDYIVINTSGVVTSRVTCTGGGGGPI